MADEEKTVAPKRPDQSRLKVTKDELDASGLSLRDFMNQKQGLTRRNDAPSGGPGRKPSGPTPNTSVKNVPKSEWDDNSTPVKSIFKSVSKDDGTGGKSTVDRQDAMLASSRKNAGRPGYDEGGDPIAKTTGDIAKGMGVNAKTLMPKRMAKGGSASSRADGCCVKGKTKGTVVGMKTGGMSC
jgi:hypothetical protein